MEIQEVSLPYANSFVQQYISDKLDVKKYFDYHIYEEQYLTERLKEVQTRQYPRRELSDYLMTFLQKFNPSEKTTENILALGKEDTYVVVGGQQAGLLTGPLYTIHKIISIVQLAKKYEEQLGVKVIPLFWVAGEDHDIEEVNNVHILKNGRIKKQKLYSGGEKSTATETLLDHEQCRKWLEDVLRSYGETEHTKQLRSFLEDALQQSRTYVDFFIHIIFHLFKDTGLVVLDSGDEGLRKIESPYFYQMVKNHESIMGGLVSQQALLKEDGFTPQIHVKERCAHLFYHEDGERLLLEKGNSNYFVTKDGKRTIAYEELLRIAEESPEKLSNNVVTRPVMQEYLLPNLAFVAGPGELAYWGELKEVFRANGMCMPPVLPRQMLTILERHIAQDMVDIHLGNEDVLTGSMQAYEEGWLLGQVEVPVTEEFSKAQKEMKEIHKGLRNIVTKVDSNLLELSIKNEAKILEQLSFLEKKVEGAIREHNRTDLEKFSRIEHSIRPLGGYQERIWNICYYLNKYGLDFVTELNQILFPWDMKHKIVII